MLKPIDATKPVALISYEDGKRVVQLSARIVATVKLRESDPHFHYPLMAIITGLDSYESHSYFSIYGFAMNGNGDCYISPTSLLENIEL